MVWSFRLCNIHFAGMEYTSHVQLVVMLVFVWWSGFKGAPRFREARLAEMKMVVFVAQRSDAAGFTSPFIQKSNCHYVHASSLVFFKSPDVALTDHYKESERGDETLSAFSGQQSSNSSSHHCHGLGRVAVGIQRVLWASRAFERVGRRKRNGRKFRCC